jgi:hypothetical protein
MKARGSIRVVTASMALGIGLACSSRPEPEAEPARSSGATFTTIAVWDPVLRSTYRLPETKAGLSPLHLPLVAELRREWSLADLELALPTDDVPVGHTFRVDPEVFLPFLRQLHPGAAAQVNRMIQDSGAFGCVIDRSDDRLDVLYRVHAGFEITPATAWIAPAQFEGRLVLDRRRPRVEHFSLALPPTRPNVVMNLRTDRGVIADIGSIPRMEIATEGAPPAMPVDSREGARAVLARAFYDFARIEWLPLVEGVRRAFDEEKLLHLVVLFGALGDESC